MVDQYIAVEVLDPREGLTNVYISIDSDPAAVQNGFLRMEQDGIKATGVFSFIERENGVVTRRYTPERPPLWVRGFRTMAAYLR